LGFDDIRGTLFFEIARILKRKRPSFFILENVKQLRGHNGGKTIQTILQTLENLNYTVKCSILNALDFGLPQKRERVFIVGFLDQSVHFEFPKGGEGGSLESILEPDEAIDSKYFASEYIIKKRMEKHTATHCPSIWHENKGGNISSYPYSCALRAGASHNYLLVNGRRRLTPRELLRLQGFSDDFKIACTDSQTRKQAGNAVPVNVIAAILQEALDAKARAERQSEKKGRLRQSPTVF
jgi:DNA (cytosine-5)-methyltransferase 1